MAAGPAAWLVLYLIFQPQPSWQGVVDNARLLVMACLIYPAAEEIAFRGLLQGWLIRQPALQHASVAGFTGANWVTSLLFSAAHLLHHSLPWAVLVMGPSLVFGWFRDRYQSIVPGLLLHILYNSGYFLLFWVS